MCSEEEQKVISKAEEILKLNEQTVVLKEQTKEKEETIFTQFEEISQLRQFKENFENISTRDKESQAQIEVYKEKCE